MTSPQNKMDIKTKLSTTLISQRWLCWEHEWDTLFALITMLYMIPSYYLMANNLNQFAIYNFLFATLFILVLLPAYYIVKIRGEPLRNLGLTTQKWLPSLVISLILAWRMMPRTSTIISIVKPELVVPTIIYNGLCFWEPFFVYCWIQLRFERAFGIIPGILGAGLCLGSYHIGTYPLEMVFLLGVIGSILAIIFRLTSNLLILWPLIWTVSSTIGTVSGGFVFGWETVWVFSIILLIQFTGIWWIAKSEQTNKVPEQSYLSLIGRELE